MVCFSSFQNEATAGRMSRKRDVIKKKNYVIFYFICDGDEWHTLSRICCGLSLNMQVLVWKKKPVLKQLLSFFQVRNLPCGVAGESRSEVKWSVFVWRQSRPRFSAAAARNRDLLGAASFFVLASCIQRTNIVQVVAGFHIFFSDFLRFATIWCDWF